MLTSIGGTKGVEVGGALVVELVQQPVCRLAPVHARVEREEPRVVKEHSHTHEAPHGDRVKTGSRSIDKTATKEAKDEKEGEVGTSNSPRVGQRKVIDLGEDMKRKNI